MPLRQLLATSQQPPLAGRPTVAAGSMAELILRYEADPSPANLNALERALFATGPVAYRTAVYGIADPRAVESLEVFRSVKRAELTKAPTND